MNPGAHLLLEVAPHHSAFSKTHPETHVMIQCTAMSTCVTHAETYEPPSQVHSVFTPAGLSPNLEAGPCLVCILVHSARKGTRVLPHCQADRTAHTSREQGALKWSELAKHNSRDLVWGTHGLLPQQSFLLRPGLSLWSTALLLPRSHSGPSLTPHWLQHQIPGSLACPTGSFWVQALSATSLFPPVHPLGLTALLEDHSP